MKQKPVSKILTFIRATIVIGLAALLIGLAACGDDDDDTISRPTNSSTQSITCLSANIRIINGYMQVTCAN